MPQKLKLTLACWDYDRTRPLMDGRVQPHGIDLDITILRPRQAFQRMLDDKEFQASELSLASYTALKSRGDCPFVAIPVALSKIFRHSCIYVRTDAGIRKPEDLRGKRVGTSQYGSTGLVFLRGMLQYDYGIASEDMHWFMGGLNTFVEPPLIPLNLPNRSSSTFSRRARRWRRCSKRASSTRCSRSISRTCSCKARRASRGCFPNYKEVEKDYYRRTRIFPIMHTVVLREDIHRDHPWAAASLYKAFCAARDLAVDGLYDTDALRVALPFLISHVEETWEVFGKDFWPYGLEANRPTWTAIGQYVHQQGLAPRPIAPEELFVSGVD